MDRSSLGWILLSALVVGCGGSDGPADAGAMDASDGSTPVVVPALQVGLPDAVDPAGIDPVSASPAATACVGIATAPVGGDPVDFNLVITEFRDDTPTEGLCVKFFADNAPTVDACDPATNPSTDFLTDATGAIAVSSLAGAWYSYRVFPQPGPTPSLQIVGSIQVNEPAPSTSGANAPGNSVSKSTLNLIPTVLGFPQAPGTALIAGTVEDCDGSSVFGATTRVFLEDGTLVTEGEAAGAPHYRFFDGEDFPRAEQQWTHTDGLYAVANVPVPSEGVRALIGVYGKLSADAEPTLVGCEEARLFADTVTIANVGPLRADGPTCPAF
ncbi:MAG: hypothetical protein OEY14_01695 [Myxococcales bacterium]|nr:hypothetical protein [Myxococcales bacterium]